MGKRVFDILTKASKSTHMIRRALLATSAALALLLLVTPPAPASDAPESPAPDGGWYARASLPLPEGGAIVVTASNKVGNRAILVQVEHGVESCFEGLPSDAIEEVPAVSASLQGVACGRRLQIEWSASGIDIHKEVTAPHIETTGDECPRFGNQYLRGSAEAGPETPATVVFMVGPEELPAQGSWRSSTGLSVNQQLGPCPR